MKKFLFFLTITLLLCGIVFGMYMEYIHISEYPVFVESYDHGIITVNNETATGTNGKYKIMCKKDSELVISVNPERTDSEYYNLEKLSVNGVDVTEQVSMLQYKTTVTQKLTVVATFEKGERPENDKTEKLSVTKPDIDKYAENTYLGAAAAYDVRDPSIIYDSESGYYYCFGSNNVVIRSTDLVNWSNRTTYFKQPDQASTNTIMSFSQFDSLSTWAKTHGYGEDETYSDKYQNRCPMSPEIVKVGSTYYLYYSIVKENSANESAIFCVKTDNLKDAVENKEWTDAGIVISSCGTNGGTKKVTDKDGNKTSVTVSEHYDGANAVHPSVVYEGKKLYMVYGGYYGTDSVNGEINLVELDASTGLLRKSSEINEAGVEISTLHGKTTYKSGTVVADPGRVPAMSEDDGSLVRGADILYNKQSGYYYLFVSYGYEQTGSSVVVGRSKSIEGPYTDVNGNSLSSYSDESMYNNGYMLMGGYNFSSSSEGQVSYTDVGRASIGSPTVIKDGDGNWFIASQSQVYFKTGTEIVTGSAIAEENSLMINSAPALEVRSLYWSDGWPVAVPEVYAGEIKDKSFKLSELYGNWDVIIFDSQADSDDADATERRTSQTVSILKKAVISENDIDNGNAIDFDGSFKKSDDGYTVTIDSVTYTVYPMAVWDWEFKEGSIVFTGIGSDGKAIWGKKKLSTTLGLYTDAFYHVYSKCEGETAETIAARIDKMSINPSQSQIDYYTDWMLSKLSAAPTAATTQ